MKNDYEIIIIIIIIIVIIFMIIIELYERCIESLSWICKLQRCCWNITIKIARESPSPPSLHIARHQR